MKTAYRPEIEVAAREHGIDADLLEAVVLQESAGRADAFRFEPDFWRRYLADNPEYKDQNPRRVSSSYGLTQIMLPTARQYGFKAEPEYLFLPVTNLHFGAQILASLLKWARGNVSLALAAYNGGKGNALAPRPQAYAREVLARLPQVH